MKLAIGLLIFILVLCVSAGLLVTKLNAANTRDAYEALEKELPSGTTLQKATIQQLCSALRVAIERNGDISVPILRVAVLLRCRAAAVSRSDVPNAPSVRPRADILALLSSAVEAFPERAAQFINVAMDSCADARAAADKVVLLPAQEGEEYPGLIPVPWEPNRNVFTPVTPVVDGR